MLGKILGSNARVKLLKLFLLHPDKKYYIRQLARDLKLQLNSVRRELENLEKFGLLLSVSSKAEDLAVMPDPYADLNMGPATADPGTTPEVEPGKKNGSAKIKERLLDKAKSGQEKKYYQANKDFILFEEFKSLIVKSQVLYEKDFIDKIKSTGQVRLLVLTGIFVGISNFPIDLLVVGRVNKPKLLKLINSLEQELGREINFTLMDPRDFRYRREVTDVFLYNILEARKIVPINEYGDLGF